MGMIALKDYTGNKLLCDFCKEREGWAMVPVGEIDPILKWWCMECDHEDAVKDIADLMKRWDNYFDKAPTGVPGQLSN